MNEVQCPTCEGGGQVPLGEHFISREMAMDAGTPAMEGMSMGIEFGQCPDCGGSGQVPSDIADALNTPRWNASIDGTGAKHG